MGSAVMSAEEPPGGADLAALGFAPKRSAGGVAIVIGLHLLLAWALVSGLAQRAVEVIKAPIQTRLIEEVRPEPPPPPPALPPPPLTPPPLVVQVPVPVVIPQAMPPPTVQTQPVAPPPAPPPPVTAVETPRPAVTVTAPPTPPPTGAQRATPEEIYSAGLRAYMNGIKRYPTSREARQLRPQGTVRVWISIDRAGQLLDAGVDGSSGSLLIDNEALRTVRNGHFPPVPAEAYAGLNAIRFVIPIEYLPPGN